MNLPFFYVESYLPASDQLELDEDTSRHVVQVLRMQEGEQLQLTDGRGSLLRANIIHAHKKHARVQILRQELQPAPTQKLAIGISLLKNASRFEWFLEKATEVGVTEIFPLLCTRTEKERFRFDRMKGILVSAILQSQQCWLPVLHEPAELDQLLAKDACSGYTDKFIAHCLSEKQRIPLPASGNAVVLIGPEGDFTEEEIEMALSRQFVAVSLGNNRLRTETAGLVAAICTQRLQ